MYCGKILSIIPWVGHMVDFSLLLARPNLKFPLPQDLEDQIGMDWAGLGVATWIDLVAV